MGKKGKARQDKFYHLAKETGYRSRASFKLLQLNRKFEFLEKCRVCIDLCAAPGSWMQVAKQHMPVSSLIVGIDLFPIKPIPGCIALQEDITTEKCRQSIKKELKTWKADIVLHDGAPNVGQNWIYDAFVQNQLVLSALKLATEFLVPGGWFVTKVFRSKDYQSLVWVLQQLFKKVHSTKPMASRMESAEIFVVCQGYKAPDKLDPKFLDPKHVFQEIEDEEEQPALKTDKKEKPKAEGYEDGVTVLHKSVRVRDFVFQENFIHVLNTAIEIVLDDPEIASHPLTTDEVKECCKDIKVLGRKDLKALLNWRKAVREDLEKKAKAADQEDVEAPPQLEKGAGDDSSEEDEELTKIDQQVDSLKAEQERDLRRKKKQVAKERKKLQQKMNLKIVLPGDSGPVQQEKSLFSLTQIKSGKDLSSLEDQSADCVVDSDEENDNQVPRPKRLRFEKEAGHIDSSGRFYRGEDDSDEELSFEDSADEYDGDIHVNSLGFEDSDDATGKDESPGKKVRFSDKVLVKEIPNKAKGKLPKNGVTEEPEKPDSEEEQGNPLITDLFHGDQNQRRKRKADLWFDKDVFRNVEDEADEDAELDLMALKYGAKPAVQVNGSADKKGKKKKRQPEVNDNEDQVSDNEDEDSDSDDSDSSDSSGSDFDMNEDFVGKKKKAKKSGSMEIVPQEKGKGRKLSLTPEALALGSMMIESKKAKRDILDQGWNRYMSDDTILPEWFVEDERRHNHTDLPITKELVDEYRNRQREVNVRPIKKVVEAKARKKKRALRKVEKAKKKASSIAENMGLSDYDKAQQIRQIYKKALQEKKKDVTYVVAKKGQTGRKAARPAGVQGRYKMVDRRLKKDTRSKKAADRKKRGKRRK